MPELPEVETARRELVRWLRGATVTAAPVPPGVRRDPRVFRKSSAPLERQLVGCAVREVARRGKWLRIELDGELVLFAHLGMTGKWVLRQPGEPNLAFERARLDVTRKGRASSVRYVDTRRFGQLIVAREDIAEWRELGPDPLAEGIDEERLARILTTRRSSVKEALMDQSILAGVGNILAIEALWSGRIDPRARASQLARADVHAIAVALKKTIARSLAHMDKSETRYVEEGAPNTFRIYGRAGAACPRCKTKLARVVIAGRGTVFCPGCQMKGRSASAGRGKRSPTK